MTDQAQRLEIATVRAEIGSNITYRFNNDAIDALLIPTDSGDIKNLKQVIADIQQEGEDKISFATTIYPTTAAGIEATTSGAIFLVASAEDDEIYAVWQNVSGSAVDTGKRALSSQAIQDAMQIAAASAAASAASATNSADSALASQASAAMAASLLSTKTDKSVSLLSWAYTSSFQLVSSTRDANSAIISANIVWPDSVTGVFTTDVASTAFPGAIDAWHATYAGTPTKTITQTTVTRDSAGAVVIQPTIVIS